MNVPDDEGVVDVGRESADAFCRALYPRLVGSLSLLTGDRLASEDLAQEALSRVWEHWAKVSRMGAPEAWAFRTAMNLRVSWFRRRAAERRAQQRLGTTRDAVGAEEWADAFAVRVEVATLPHRQRVAVVLRYYAGLSERETAIVMKCSPGTVKAHVHKAIITLRRRGMLDEAEVR